MPSITTRPSFKSCILTTCVTLLIGANLVFAEPEAGTQGDDIPFIGEKHEQAIDNTHQATSDKLLSMATWVDSFFGDERYLLEENKTRAKLRLSFGYTRFDNFEFSPRVRLRLKLPQLSKKAFLIISTSDDDDFGADGNPISDNPRNEDSERSDLSASLRYFLKVGKRYHLSTTFGASFNYLYGGLRYRYKYDFGPWQGRFTNTLKYYTDDGWENTTAIDMERHFSKRWFFRTSANVDWYEEEDGLPHTLIFQLYHVLSQERGLRYEVGSYFNTEPSHKLTDVQLRFCYRQRLYRDWLILEIAPQISFPEDHDKKANPGIVLRLEADFGYMAEQDAFRAVFGL